MYRFARVEANRFPHISTLAKATGRTRILCLRPHLLRKSSPSQISRGYVFLPPVGNPEANKMNRRIKGSSFSTGLSVMQNNMFLTET
jgi:hypothetical protein